MPANHHNAHSQPVKLLLTLLCVALAILLIGYEYLMLQWPMMREAHYLHYIAYLINEHGFAPYRDIYETSWFGTFLFHMLVGKIFGYTAVAFRCADMVFLALLLAVTWAMLRKLDTLLAWVATLSFALAYLHYGPANTLQRDYILLLPVSTALFLALQTQWSTTARALSIGACFAAAASIKPHVLIGMPPVLLLLYSQSAAREKSISKLFLATGIASLVTFSAGLLWLWLRGGLQDFIDMSLHYLPLYQDLNGAHAMTTPEERVQNTLHWWKAFTWIWPYVATAGIVRGWLTTPPHSQQRALIITLAAMMVCFNLYPLPAGKFWDYHWIPFTYFALLCSSFLLMPAQNKQWWSHLMTLACVLYFLQTVNTQYFPWFRFMEQIKRYPDVSVSTQSQDDIATFLSENLHPGDTIQIIDQGGPATEYLLRAHAVLATRYVGSFVFLHHISNPHVQAMQQDFIAKLNAAPPKLLLVMEDYTKPTGIDTRRDIPGLDDFIHAHYQPLQQGAALTIWQRNDASRTSTAP